MNDKELDAKIKEYFDSNKIEPDKSVLQEIKQEISSEKKLKPKQFYFWKTFIASAAMLIIVILSVVLPIVLKKDSDDSNYYTYTDADINKIEIEKQVVIDYINTNLPKYAFIFEQCDFEKCIGFYTKEKNELVALSAVLMQNDMPYAKVNFDLIINKRYIFSGDESFKDESKIILKEECRLYLKEKEEFFTSYLYALFEYNQYNLYLCLDALDYEFIEQF